MTAGAARVIMTLTHEIPDQARICAANLVDNWAQHRMIRPRNRSPIVLHGASNRPCLHGGQNNIAFAEGNHDHQPAHQ